MISGNARILLISLSLLWRVTSKYPLLDTVRTRLDRRCCWRMVEGGCPRNFVGGLILTESPYKWMTHGYCLRHKRSIEEMQSDLDASTSAASYSWIKKANITNEMAGTTERVLDIGCGWGRETHRYKNSVGIDICVPFLKTTKHYSDNEFIVASAEYLPFKTGAFTCAIISEVIEHLNQQEKAIAEAKRVLIPEGRFIVQTPNRRLTKFRSINTEYGHVHEFTTEELKTLLKNHGFNILRLTGSTIPYIPTDSPYYHLNFNRFFFAFWRLLNRLIPIKWDIIRLAENSCQADS